ncbi:MAG: Efflux transporter permease subunit [Acidobacteriota bacterium]|nr:Efflux transporter permease subunit [Acidobacteriota bacterium]
MIDKIIDFSLKNRLLVCILAFFISVVGMVVYHQMPKDIYPDLNAPIVNIITTNEGMAAEDVERLITFPLESLLNGTPGVTRVRSESTTGESVVTIEFDWGMDIYLARQIVMGKLDLLLDELPTGTSRPTLGPVSSRMGEIFEFAVTGEGASPLELRSISDWQIRYRLLGVEGVSFVINLGGFVKQYQVFLKPNMMKHYDIAIKDVKEAIEGSNRNFSGGLILKKNQELLIKGIGKIESTDHICNTVITSRNNVPVYVKDVTEIKTGGKFRRGDAGYNGKEAVSVVVQKQYGGNTLNTIDHVKQFLHEVKKDLPKNVDITPYYDQSKLIESSIKHVEISMLIGGFLVVLLIFFFLANGRASLIASLTIPISIFVSLIIMHLFGVALTVMALGGLAIGIGKMANGSVIMVENIYRHIGSKNDPGKNNVLLLTAQGAKEIGNYLFAATLIIIFVFLPLLTIEGIGGRMFRPTAFAVAAALFGSLIINITLQPVLMSIFTRSEQVNKRHNRFVESLTGLYEKLLKSSFTHKKILWGGSLAIVLPALICFNFLGKEFVPAMDEGSLVVSTVMLPETSLEESVRIGEQVSGIIRSFPEVISVTRTTGMAEASEHVHPVNHSHYMVELKPKDEREHNLEDLTQAMRSELDKIPGIVYIFEQPIANKLAEMITGSEGEIAIKLFGKNLQVLGEKIEDIKEALVGIKGVADLQVEQTAGIPQMEIKLDREKLARFGIRVEDAADMIEIALNGLEVTNVYEEDRITAVLLRLSEDFRRDEESVKNMLIDTMGGQRIPLSQLADISFLEGPQTIFRENLMRRKIILCNIVDRDIGSFVDEAREVIARRVSLPQGYFITFGGQFESQQKSMKQLSIMMLIVAVIVFVILFSSLGSFRQSFLVLSTVPLTFSGGIIALYISGQTLNVSSLIGLIALFGISLQNGIILVGKINRLRKEGKELREAVLQGAVIRFRPIFMTELILILGVLPLILGSASGSELHRPLAVVYIGGFLVAIFYEQFVLPVLYEGLARLKKERRMSL